MNTTTRTESDGKVYWPDASLNSEKYYGIDWTTFLSNEGFTLTGYKWTLPRALTKMDEDSTVDLIKVKIKAETFGTHKITCEVNAESGAKTQKFIRVIYLKVV